jgi:hypothetical protein
MSKDGLVDYGHGRVQPHPIPERQRPVVNDNPEIQNSRDARLKEEVDELKVRERAAQLAGRTHDVGSGREVWIRMPSGQKCFLGGEALVSALANGGQPVDGQQFKPTINGQVAGHSAPRIFTLK